MYLHPMCSILVFSNPYYEYPKFSMIFRYPQCLAATPKPGSEVLKVQAKRYWYLNDTNCH